MKILSFSKNIILSKILEKIAMTSNLSYITFDNIDNAIENLLIYKPDLIIISEDFSEDSIISLCRKIREHYSLVIPINLLVNFYSSLNKETFRNLGVELINYPVTECQLRTKILPLENTKEAFPIDLKIEEIFEKLKPYIKQEITREIADVMKKILEVLEREND